MTIMKTSKTLALVSLSLGLLSGNPLQAEESLLPEDFQRFEVTLSEAHGGDNQDMTLHLSYQNGAFLQGWVYVGDTFTGSRADVSGLSWDGDALQGRVDVVLQSGRRNNRFFVIDLNAGVGPATSVRRIIVSTEAWMGGCVCVFAQSTGNATGNEGEAVE